MVMSYNPNIIRTEDSDDNIWDCLCNEQYSILTILTSPLIACMICTPIKFNKIYKSPSLSKLFITTRQNNYSLNLLFFWVRENSIFLILKRISFFSDFYEAVWSRTRFLITNSWFSPYAYHFSCKWSTFHAFFQ